jgi:tetratricopeptide (TPR) repeat protein
MKKTAFFFILLLIIMGPILWAQQKYALVIGNGNYTGNWNSLSNPVNDANDMAEALESLGFNVDKVLNGNLDQMETAVMNLQRRLSASPNSYGFFYYAGHGAQSRDRENYLIPADANTPSLNLLAQRALPVQFVLDELRDAGNVLNMIVLDACRNVPTSLERSDSRGLSVISSVPPGTIVMYATAANSTAADGEGRNGLFTSHLLRNLVAPGLDVNEIFRRTGSDVARATNGTQYPETRYMYFESAYLGTAPVVQPATALNMEAARASYERGMELLDDKIWNLDGAIAQFTMAILLYSDYADAYYCRGYAYYYHGDYELAIADFTEAIRFNPNNADAYAHRGLAYYDKGDYDRAIAGFAEAIRLDPDMGYAYYNRAIAYLRKGNLANWEDDIGMARHFGFWWTDEK